MIAFHSFLFRAGGPEDCILDTDLVAAFDLLCMQWVWMVLEKKFMDMEVIKRLKNEETILQQFNHNHGQQHPWQGC